MTVASTTPVLPDQFIRRLSVVVSGANGGKGIELGDFRVHFRVNASDFESPNNASIRIYNVAPSTAKQIKGEFSTVTLNAGYVNGAFGAIFQGTIKQLRTGKEDAVTSYLDLLCADGDAVNFTVMNTSYAAGTNPAQQAEAAAAALQMEISQATDLSKLVGGTRPNPRGKVAFGMARDQLRSAARQLSATWSVQNGVIQVLPLNSYLATGDVPILSAATGVVGIPEATDEGIKVRTLLNPKLVIGGLVQIDNELINQTFQGLGQTPGAFVPYNQWTGAQYIANASNDGRYRVYCVEHEGDSRGGPWYSDLICLLVDASSGQVVTTPD